MKTYRIETDRLVIRCYKEADALLLKKSIDESLDHLKQWMPWAWNEPESLEQKTIRLQKFREQFELGEDYAMAVFNDYETELLGSSGFHTRIEETAREIGYWVNVNHIKKGIATEIVEAITKVAFEIEQLQRLEIRCDKNNLASVRVAERAGYNLKEILIGNAKDVYGNDRDTMVWEMTREKYFLNPAPLSLRAFDAAGNLLK